MEGVGAPHVAGCRIGELLGEGATGAVYAATDAKGTPLAIKFLHDDLAGDAEAVARFKREARNCGRIRSPYVAAVVGAGKSDGRYWIAYVRVAGETLASRLGRERALAPDTAARVVEQVLLGLEAAHDVGVIHRDIKPANILLARGNGGRREEERACILDFGASKRRAPEGGSGSTGSEALTTTTAMLGTINYMPPEQLGGAATVDARADLYAAGVVAFRALCGQLPFVGDSETVVMHAKVHRRARTLGEATGAPWPAALEDVVARALERDAADRYPSAARMREAWGRAFAGGTRLPQVAQRTDERCDERTVRGRE